MNKKIITAILGMSLSTLACADVQAKNSQEIQQKAEDKGIDYQDFFDSQDKEAETMKKQHEKEMKDPEYAKYYNKTSEELSWMD
ncbi:hypothetical protein [Francisella philomiragia]|nr:hypothetical protein [Francisella philomiragia]MBK2257581.1 hypothetical protein [Francisella philomiragia]MBK2272103.1 hypothetical protein [Francisella philomiragia]MBK2295485.1 hypothetical protein [Francisella philomiragia]MBK2320242.1 hypothetical protein [Francisella philomiragia]